jgi:hypothetical protein
MLHILAHCEEEGLPFLKAEFQSSCVLVKPGDGHNRPKLVAQIYK